MKRTVWISSLLLILGLTSCTGTATPAPLPTVVLDSAPSSGSSSRTVSASGTIVPLSNVELFFPSGGRVGLVTIGFEQKVAGDQALATLDTAALEAQVASAEGALLSAQADLNLLKRLGEIRERIQAAQGRVQQAQGALDAARANLAAASLIAPFGGTIVDVQIFGGEYVLPGQVVIVLADLDFFVVETTDLSERDIANIKAGQRATVYIEALDLEVAADVTSISLLATTLGGDVVYKVTLYFDDQPPGLMWGMNAEVEIVVK